MPKPVSIPPQEGEVFTVEYPFIRIKVTVNDGSDEGGTVEIDSWQPGCRNEMRGHGEYADAVTEADAHGQMALTVVSVHKPGRFPTRVFFVRKFTTPDGKAFGKGKLHIVTLEKFRRISRAYQHDYELAGFGARCPDCRKHECRCCPECGSFPCEDGCTWGER